MKGNTAERKSDAEDETILFWLQFPFHRLIREYIPGIRVGIDERIRKAVPARPRTLLPSLTAYAQPHALLSNKHDGRKRSKFMRA